MFDISFSELLLCFVVALVVLGPERMPGVARAVGRWTGKARGYMRNLTAELERETHIAEMKRQVEDAHRILREQSDEVRANVDLNLKAIREETHSVVDSVKTAVHPPLESAPVVTAAPLPQSPPITPAPSAAPSPTVAAEPSTPAKVTPPPNYYGP